MSKLPSDALNIDKTNDLLAKVPGLNFKIPGLAEKKQPGAMSTSGGLDPATLQVESTNEHVKGILGESFFGKTKIVSGMVAQPTVEEVVPKTGILESAKTALEHLKNARLACENIEGLEDYGDEIDEMVADLDTVINSTDAAKE